MIELIDTHCHIHDSAYHHDREEVIERARENGVVCQIAIGSGEQLKSARDAIELAERHDDIYATVGIHPHDASTCREEVFDEIERWTEHPRVVGLGEVGLDFYRNLSPPEVQKEVFRRLLRMANEKDLPIVIHDRDAHRETLEILKSEGVGNGGGVMHCFSGDYPFAKACLDLGFLISISGVVTFKNAGSLREVVQKLKVEQMVVETDSPYLAPTPYRGKRNEPGYVRHVAETIAELKGLSLEDVGRITTWNARRLFRIEKGELEAKIAYPIRESLYLNITNRCTIACIFCPKFDDFMVKGHYLRLRREPTFEEVREAVGDPSRYREVVFCGYGEPTLRLDMVKKTARWLKEKQLSVRLNTDGLGNFVHKRNILPELAGLIDTVSVSLNAQDAQTYARLCRSKYGGEAYPAVKDFIREAKKYVPQVIATVVTHPDVSVERCRQIAEEELGVLFRAREYNEVG